jgi:hypothetical protein
MTGPGGVHGDQAFGEGQVEAGTQDGPDVVAGGRPGRTDSGVPLADGRVGAGAPGDDLLVALFDGGEPDVGGAELV